TPLVHHLPHLRLLHPFPTRRSSDLTDHDGYVDDWGGIERWLILTDGLGLDRDYAISQEGALPATKYAVEAHVHFVREKPLVEARSEEHTSELQSRENLICRLLLEKK